MRLSLQILVLYYNKLGKKIIMIEIFLDNLKKLELNKIFLVKIVQVTDITYKTIYDPYMDTLTTRHLASIKQAIVYKKDEYTFVEIKNNQKYSSDIDFAGIGDLVIDPRTLVPISIVCEKLNIELPDTENITKRQLVKHLSKK